MGLPAVRLLQELKKPFTRAHFLRIFIVFGATVLVGAICGVIGFGAGTIFMLLYILFLSSSTLEGAGTGSMIMATLMAAMMSVYAEGVQFDQVWEILVIAIPCDLIGALLASLYTVKLSESRLSGMISVLLFFIGIFMTVEHILVPEKSPG
jgi:uncharacterized membrane protein YfcA